VLRLPFGDGSKTVFNGQRIFRGTVQPGRQTEAMSFGARDGSVRNLFVQGNTQLSYTHGDNGSTGFLPATS